MTGSRRFSRALVALLLLGAACGSDETRSPSGDTAVDASPGDCQDGAPCAAPCFEAATCQNGECVPDPAAPRVCPAPTDPCTAELLCEPSTGECSGRVPADSGTPCEADGNICTLDACDDAGQCVALGALEACVEENQAQPCWTHTCNSKSGCVRSLFVEGGSCDDGDSCTMNDTCGYATAGETECLGTPIPVDDANPCTTDYCADGTVHHDAADGAACEGADPCGSPGACAAGQCVVESPCACDRDLDCAPPDDLCAGTWFCDKSGDAPACAPIPGSPVTCPAHADPCMSNACDPATGQCVAQAAADGEACDDGDACTFDEACLSGSCAGGAPVTCDDGQFCNGVETCDALAGCVGGAPPPLDDNVTCTADSCDEGDDEVVHAPDDDGCATDAPCATVACVPSEGGCVASVVADCCGNGTPEGDEQCDDGNADDGDGCSAICEDEGAGLVGDLTPGDPGRWSDGGVGTRCYDYLAPPGDQTPATADGVYTIDPDGAGAVSGELAVYCDMTTDGGGWTLIHKTDKGSASDHTDDGHNVTALTSPGLDAVAVLRRSTLALFGRGTFRVLTTRAPPNDRIYYRYGPFYTTDNHFNDLDGDQANDVFNVEGKRSWSDAWTPVDHAQLGAHSIHVGATPLPGPYHSGLHIGVKRFGGAGIWVNTSPASATGSHHAGTSWVR